MKKVFLLMVLFASVTLFGVPALPDPFEVVQPDGYRFMAKAIGDEYFHYVIETATGKAIHFDEQAQYWVYSALPGETVDWPQIPVSGKTEARFAAPTKEQVKNARESVLSQSRFFLDSIKRSRSAPTTGTINVPVVLINFNDRATTYTNANFNQIMFGNNPALAPNGSVKDYYYEVSYNQLTLTGNVLGWYTASNGHNYYGQNNVSVKDIYVQQLVTEAVNAADPYVDFSQFDNDSDGFVDMLVVFHQGFGEESTLIPTDIWSHQGALPYPGVSVDGVNVFRYTIQPELFHTGITTIGVIAHEAGHAFGLPDLYDYSNTTEGIGRWGIMGSGVWNTITRQGDCPAHFCAWSKKELGWLTMDSVNGYNGSKTLFPSVTGKTVLKYANPSDAKEYFLMEYRKKTGFDQGLPGEGMLLLHIDDNCGNNDLNSNPHRRVDVEEADGLNHLDSKTNSGDAGDVFPGTANNTIFNDSSSPDAKWYSGTNSALQISLIQRTANQVSMNFTATTPNYSLTVATLPFSGMNLIIGVSNHLSPYTVSLVSGTYQVTIPQTLKDESAFVPGNDARYTFQNWEDASTNNLRSVVLTANKTITATMQKGAYVKTETVPAGIGVVPGEGWYLLGSNVQFIPPVIVNYQFSHWEVDGVNVGNASPLPRTVNTPELVRAHYLLSPSPVIQIAVLLPKFPTSGSAPILFKILNGGVSRLQMSLTLNQATYISSEIATSTWNTGSSSVSGNTFTCDITSKSTAHSGLAGILKINVTGVPGAYPAITAAINAFDQFGNPMGTTILQRNHLSDLNQDGSVNPSDWTLFSQRYGMKRGDAGWDDIGVYCDLDNSDSVGLTIWDIALFALHSSMAP